MRATELDRQNLASPPNGPANAFHMTLPGLVSSAIPLLSPSMHRRPFYCSLEVRFTVPVNWSPVT